MTWEETISDNREPYLQEGGSTWCSRRTPSPTSVAQVVGQTGPYFVTGQQVLVEEGQRHQGRRRPQGQEGLLGDRVDVAGERRGRGRQGAPARHLLPVRATRSSTAPSTRCRPTARSCSASPRRTGRAQGRRRRVLRGAHRRRLLQGPPGDVRVDQRRAQESYEDGAWDKAFEATLGGQASRRPSRRSWTSAA